MFMLLMRCLWACVPVTFDHWGLASLQVGWPTSSILNQRFLVSQHPQSMAGGTKIPIQAWEHLGILLLAKSFFISCHLLPVIQEAAQVCSMFCRLTLLYQCPTLRSHCFSGGPPVFSVSLMLHYISSLSPDTSLSNMRTSILSELYDSHV